MTVVKPLCIGKFGNKVDRYNNTFHRTTKLKPIEVKKIKSINFDVENNYKKPKVGDYERISKYKNIFAKGYTGKKKFFLLRKLKLRYCGNILLVILTVKFYFWNF